MEQTTQTHEGGAAPQRPVFLTVLCILSFIAAGLAIFGYIGAFAVIGMASAAASAVGDGLSAAASEGMGSEASAAFSSAMAAATPSVGLVWAYIIVGFATTLASLFGVIKMWKLQKQGFFIYTGAAVVSLVMGIIYSGFGVVSLLFAVLFIVLYGLNLKHMK